MSAYRRFVAYVYEYQGEQKKGNRGFVKVESRNGNCMIDVHLHCPNLAPEQECSIYGFVRKNLDLHGIELGKCRTVPGKVECRLNTRADSLNGQPVRLDDLGGMIFLIEGGGFYGTQWDDASISPMAFKMPKKEVKPVLESSNIVGSKREASNPNIAIQKKEAPIKEDKAEVGEKEAKAGEKVRSIAEEEKREGKENSKDDVTGRKDKPVNEEKVLKPEARTEAGPEEEAKAKAGPEEEARTEAEPEEEAKAEAGPEEEAKAEAGAEDKVEAEAGPEEKVQAEAGAEDKVEAEAGPEEKVQAEMEAKDKVEARAEPGEEVKAEAEPEVREETKQQENGRPDVESVAKNVEDQTSETSKQEPIMESGKIPEKEEVPEAEETVKTNEMEAWDGINQEQENILQAAEVQMEDKVIEERRPEPQESQFWPFEDGEIMECRKIEPRDFRFFQKRDWPLKNNRFLLHGFYQFGYLLLGKLRGTNQYILGVPGVYEQQERFMANMFGFPHFKTSRLPEFSKVAGGKGGFWYRLINTPNLNQGNRR